MARNIAAVMDSIGDALATITGLRAYGFPPKSAQPPFAFPDSPDDIAFDGTFRRGHDRTRLSVIVGVADVVDRSAWAQIAEYAAGAGVRSVKEVLESFAGEWASLRVESVEFRPVQLSAGVYAGAVFTVDVVY